MAENYNKALELYNKLKATNSTDMTPSAPQAAPQRTATPDVLSGDVNFLDEQVFGKYVPTEGSDETGNPRKLLEIMKEVQSGHMTDETRTRIEENVRNSKLPKAILDSMISNPLIETKIGKDDVDEYMEKTMKKNTNIDKIAQISQKLNEYDEKKNAAQIMPQQPQQTVAATINEERLTQLIEQTIERKMNELFSKMPLNESTHSAPAIKAIQEKDGGRFLMVDTDNNVYECTMTYKGKNRKPQR